MGGCGVIRADVASPSVSRVPIIGSAASAANVINFLMKPGFPSAFIAESKASRMSQANITDAVVRQIN